MHNFACADADFYFYCFFFFVTEDGVGYGGPI